MVKTTTVSTVYPNCSRNRPDYILSPSPPFHTIKYAKGGRTHRHLVCELHPYSLTKLRAWLRIVHFSFIKIISCVFTIPRAISSATVMFPCQLGSKIFRMSPQFDGVAHHKYSVWWTSSPFRDNFWRPDNVSLKSLKDKDISSQFKSSSIP